LIPLGSLLIYAVDIPTLFQHNSNRFGGLSAAPDPMKTIRKDWPIVRQYVKAGSTYFHVDMRRKHYQGQKFKNFTSRDKALEFASEIGKKVAMSGVDSIRAVQEGDRVKAWGEQCALYGKTVEQAIETALAVWGRERKVMESPFMAELLNVWMLDKIENPLKPLRPRSQQSIRWMANTFQADFGKARIKEIDRARIEQYLRDKDVSNQSRKNLRNYLGQFFNWAIRNGHYDKNPVENIEIHVQAGVPKYFNVGQCVAILKQVLREENAQMRAYFALCLFGGIRPEEAERMAWGENVKMDTKEIYIPAAISKTKKDRLFLMPGPLYIWLGICPQGEPLIPVNFRKLKDRVTKSLKFDWIQDGLRHTFATFHYAKHKNLEELRHIMGNSPSVIERLWRSVKLTRLCSGKLTHPVTA
jgi:integrase